MAAFRPWRSYAARRWRTTGLFVALLVGTVVYALVADRGHDPMWQREVPDVEDVIFDADGHVLYVVTRDAERMQALAAVDRDGTALWNATLGRGEVFVATGRDWVAVARDGDVPRLTLFRSTDGVVLLEERVAGTPVGLAADAETAALALSGANATVQVWVRLAHDHEVSFAAPVTAVDVAGETVAIGAVDGRLVVERRGTVVADLDVALSVRAVALSADGTRVTVGGLATTPGDFSGGVVVYDLEGRPQAGPRWRSVTQSAVGAVDIAADGSRVLALEETPGGTVLRFTPGEGGDTWRFPAPGVVARAGTTGSAGARLASDGRGAAIATLTGGISWLDAEEQVVGWTWRAKGSTVVAFPQRDPTTFAANARLSPTEGYDRVVSFDVGGEPFDADMARLVPTLLAAELVAGALVLGVGRVRELRA
ncbi:MAG TPA: hypothetical protein VI997_11675 [Candidatus Thermoplasmatota archaeon]|nr:hypothetical protein [Candidatus Thermoplasmatota archaeon]